MSRIIKDKESRFKAIEEKLYELISNGNTWVEDALYMLYKYENTPRMEQAMDDIERIMEG